MNCGLIFLNFLEKISHTPKPLKINNIELKKNDSLVLLVVCSAIESIRGSLDVKSGLIAFRYLYCMSSNKFNWGNITNNIIIDKIGITVIRIAFLLKCFLNFNPIKIFTIGIDMENSKSNPV